MAFKGWQAEAIEFFEGLEADNSKSYWTANKAVYEEQVLAPMQELLKEVAGELGEGKIFRPYRDVRFSKDKSPYKTNIAAVVEKGGYMHLDADSFGVGSGMYMMAADQLERYRAAVAADGTGPDLEAIISKLQGKGVTVGGHDTLKTAPKGYPKDHPRLERLRYKGITSWQQWEVGPWLATSQPKKRLVAFFRTSQPLNDWLSANVGSSQLEPAGRR
jgi:uncharacterized protein (TIGR02453 family)